VPELAFIALGSNIEPERYLPQAARYLRELGTLVACSNVYQNPAISSDPPPDYLNAAVLIETRLRPFEIRSRLREIETQLDRVRTHDKYAARTIDLDLCLYGDLQIEHPDLVLPDPEVLVRPHLAVTLAELRPDQPYPGSGRSLRSIAAELSPMAVLTLRSDINLEGDSNEPVEEKP
jgi:2-amino-4-hydroxy-6-hydroxymethyldihydropteridine diphosphokinase